MKRAVAVKPLLIGYLSWELQNWKGRCYSGQFFFYTLQRNFDESITLQIAEHKLYSIKVSPKNCILQI